MKKGLSQKATAPFEENRQEEGRYDSSTVTCAICMAGSRAEHVYSLWPGHLDVYKRQKHGSKGNAHHKRKPNQQNHVLLGGQHAGHHRFLWRKDAVLPADIPGLNRGDDIIPVSYTHLGGLPAV